MSTPSSMETRLHNARLDEVEAELLQPRARPSWLKSRLRMVANFVGAVGMTLVTGGHAWRRAPFQTEYPAHDMPLRNLPASFEGMRIAQISNLHTAHGTPLWYLRKVIAEVNGLKPDIVLITGDLVTHGLKWVEAAADIVGAIEAPKYAIFGNHDYTHSMDTWEGEDVATALQRALERRNVTVLRNRAVSIEHPEGRLWLVGLEDLWSGRFDAAKAFANVDPNEPTICLSHNPDTVLLLQRYAPQWVLAGHTHGGQIRLPLLGSVVMPLRHKEFDAGFFQVGPTRMYITRGIGFRVRVRFRCPPEAPIFTLRDQQAAVSLPATDSGDGRTIRP